MNCIFLTASIKKLSALCLVFSLIQAPTLKAQAQSFENYKPRLFAQAPHDDLQEAPRHVQSEDSYATGNAEDVKTRFTFKSPTRKRKYILLPALGSFILPGLDQWAMGQVNPGMLYSGYAISGYGIAFWAEDKIKVENIRNTVTDSEGGLATDPTYQLRSAAYQATMAAGFLSAYHSFRTYAETSGDTRYDYIKNNGDTVENVMLSPFKFKFLARPTTYLPLLAAAAIMISSMNDDNARKVNSSDKGYLAVTSYQAGVGEEAFFRGFLFPYLATSTGSDFWGNILSSVVFGAAHISDDNEFPVIQTLFGMYDAYLTKRNNWSIQESTFIHFWWDVLVFAGAYAAAPESRIHYNKSLINFVF